MLDDLIGVIKTVQRRIQQHGGSLRENETRTRMALIDPLLTALGWDVADPTKVTPEYNVSGNRADYALIKPQGSPAATVEAKKLGEALEPHRMQMLNYSNASGVQYAGLTDGNHWELYEVFKQAPLDDRRILEVSVVNIPAHQTALQLLLLWRPNLASGEPVSVSQPIIAPVLTPESIENAVIVPELPTTSEREGWASLADLQSVTGRPPPSVIRLPDGAERNITHWWEVPFQVAGWQVRTGKLIADACPIWSGRTKYIVNTEPRHSNGTGFNQPRPLVNGLFLDTPYDAAGLINSAKSLLQRFGEDAANV